MIKEIDLQQKGAGANGDCRYWSEYSGYDVKARQNEEYNIHIININSFICVGM